MVAKPAKFKIGGPGREPVEADAYEVVRDPGPPPGGFLCCGIDTTGRRFRVPVPGATVNGRAVPTPSADEQRAMAPEEPNETNARRAATGGPDGHAGKPPKK